MINSNDPLGHGAQEDAGAARCRTAAQAAGITANQADNCEDCEHRCPACPWRTTPDLQGLRAALLNPGPVERDEDGYWCSLALPHCDEDVDYAKLLAAFGLDVRIADAESQMDVDAYEAMCEAGNCTAWTPEPPEGDGWVMVSLHDTEDGAVAFYVRPAAPAKKRWPIGVEAVAVVRPGGEAGPTLHWLLEGGIHAAAEGGEAVLVIAGAPITDDTGHGYVYLATETRT